MYSNLTKIEQQKMVFQAYITNYRKNNAAKHKKQYKEYYKTHKTETKLRCKIYQKSNAKYDLYVKYLTVDEAPRLSKDKVSLEVKCRYCGRYFIPNRRAVKNRINALESPSGSENFLYCSKHCKTACPVYGQRVYPKSFKQATSREVQSELRKLVLARDNHTCQKYGSGTEDIQLHCHHILPLNESPIESADMDNCITLCKNCHKEAHELPDCGYHALRCRNYL